MRPASNGLATTLLLLVPLVAVPFAAAIGLPQLSATPAAETGALDVRPIASRTSAEALPDPGKGGDAGLRPSADDLFAPLNAGPSAPQETSYEEAISADARASDRRARVRSRLAALAAAGEPEPAGLEQETTPARDGARPAVDGEPIVRQDAFDADVPSEVRVAAGPEPRVTGDIGGRGEPFGPDDASLHGSGSVPAGEREAAVDLTWAHAVQRMKELGIEDFALSPGDADHGFHFRCQLGEAGDSGIIHRFEAEAADPLMAVAAVIEQVESWLEQTAGTDTELDGRLARLGRDLQRSTR